MNMRSLFVTSGLAILLHLAQATAAETNQAPITGYNCVFLGHSFFCPIANGLPPYALRSGFKTHRQVVGMGGGQNGSPGKLWDSLPQDHAARKAIKTGTVDLMGVTYYPGVGSALTDYRKWIDFALQHNPRTKFFIMTPWPMYQGSTLLKYEATWTVLHAEIHLLIDQLRKAYPGTVIFCIPQGKGMVELWRRFEQGKLPDVSVLMRPNGQGTASSLFLDPLGHGGKIPVQLGELLWLSIIYQVDVRDVDWNADYPEGLDSLAYEIARGDPYARISPVGSGAKP